MVLNTFISGYMPETFNFKQTNINLHFVKYHCGCLSNFMHLTSSALPISICLQGIKSNNLVDRTYGGQVRIKSGLLIEMGMHAADGFP